MSAHRVLRDLYEAFKAGIGPGIVQDPGNGGTIRFEKWGQICEIVSTGAETRILANPNRPGIRAALRLLTDGGDVVVTASNGLNVLLETTATFADASDLLSLLSVTLSAAAGTYRWEVLEGNVGTVISSTSPSATPSTSPSAS